MHSSDSLKCCQRGEGGRARNGEGDRHCGVGMRDGGGGVRVSDGKCARRQKKKGRRLTPLLQHRQRVQVKTELSVTGLASEEHSQAQQSCSRSH